MTDSLARRLMRDLLGPPLAPSRELVVEEGPAAGQRLSLPETPTQILIGRGENCGWVVLDPDLSRVHAAVAIRATGVWLHDSNSKNGTRLDELVVPSDDVGLRLRDGARFKLGKTTIRYREPPAGQDGASTRTGTAADVAAVPPRWPIAVAALVALLAIAVLIALVLS
jgi:predicted component of type VI protein secretion system